MQRFPHAPIFDAFNSVPLKKKIPVFKAHWKVRCPGEATRGTNDCSDNKCHVRLCMAPQQLSLLLMFKTLLLQIIIIMYDVVLCNKFQLNN